LRIAELDKRESLAKSGLVDRYVASAYSSNSF
jgi:hypothetical protein